MSLLTSSNSFKQYENANNANFSSFKKLNDLVIVSTAIMEGKQTFSSLWNSVFLVFLKTILVNYSIFCCLRYAEVFWVLFCHSFLNSTNENARMAPIHTILIWNSFISFKCFIVSAIVSELCRSITTLSCRSLRTYILRSITGLIWRSFKVTLVYYYGKYDNFISWN